LLSHTGLLPPLVALSRDILLASQLVDRLINHPTARPKADSQVVLLSITPNRTSLRSLRKISNTKLQITNNIQIPNLNFQTMFGVLSFGFWNLFGICFLDFGISTPNEVRCGLV